MNKKIIIWVGITAFVALAAFLLFGAVDKTELKSIKSMDELNRRYEGRVVNSGFTRFLAMPWSFLHAMTNGRGAIMYDYQITNSMSMQKSRVASFDRMESAAPTGTLGGAQGPREFSTTNIQVENVDEADIIKTDGNYIYSLSGANAVITNVIDKHNPVISAKIAVTRGIPQDLILYKDMLVVISAADTSRNSSYYSGNGNTLVEIYDIANKEKPSKLKSYTLHQPYYTSRCIANKLYIISGGWLRKKDGKTIDIEYGEDGRTKKIAFKNIKYFPDIRTNYQTIFSFVDLDKPKASVDVNSYLIDISNAYVSEKNIYLAHYNYNRNIIPVRALFGFEGLFGPIKYAKNSDEGGKTKIYKFNILDNGKIKYSAKTATEGKTINQFSMDEYNDNLRVALWDWSTGSRVVVFNDKMREIGHSDYLAKGEQMYSSRFMGEKAYFITYLTTDPLYVIDLSIPEEPAVLGELKIPGYSTYLHPYDENHLLGFGMESEEIIHRDSMGRVISTRAVITGMKMALFDVSDVNNPTQIANVVIGDRRTTSSILQNHKALLFSKEKELLAIPVNNYRDDFAVDNAPNRDAVMRSFSEFREPYVSEGYFVYNVNLKGFTKKGVITHDVVKRDKWNRWDYGNRKMLRGLYIDNDLFTVSESMLKVNRLDNLEKVSEMKIEGGQ